MKKPKLELKGLNKILGIVDALEAMGQIYRFQLALRKSEMVEMGFSDEKVAELEQAFEESLEQSLAFVLKAALKEI